MARQTAGPKSFTQEIQAMMAGIPVLKTGSRIWQVLGGALYRARPLLAITIHELFQNSRGAKS